MYNEAEAAFRQAMRLAPNYPSSAFRLAVQVLAPQGRVEEAVVLLQDLEKAHPENKEYRKYIERLSKR
ncbi:MAG: tetratricopeptide repeat protein [Kiritimatiellae bacterium]|nr:tetratricopeptide repeat protein [Kiritimatiellia bacterium]